MGRDIFLDYQVGKMTADDFSVSVAVCFAPYDDILALTTGIFCAANERP